MTMAAPEQRFGLPPECLARLIGVLRRHPEVEQALVYGSRAMGRHRGGSDIDLTLIGERLSWRDLQAIEQEIDDILLPYKVDLSLFSQITNDGLRDHIRRWGQPLEPGGA